MAPPKPPAKNKKHTHTLRQLYAKYVSFEYVKFLVCDPAAIPIVAVIILLAELALNVLVIRRVPYTEIDWIAYMQEVEGFLNGTTNYALLKGDTGPLVYPAGFVYIYSALYYLTGYGQNIRLAQYIFAGIYQLQMWLVLRLYAKSRKVPPYVLVISAFTSYRIHSIYVLRLFNDPIAILFLYAALNLFLDQRWTWGSVCFSLGVAVKMNVLLFAPALLLLYVTNLGYLRTLLQLAVCGSVQLLLGAPFLLTYPLAYLKGSFDLARVFEHKWTVNYRFLPRAIFEHPTLHLCLLASHLLLLLAFATPTYRYFRNYVRLRELQKQLQPQIQQKNQEIKDRASKPKPKKKSPKEEEEELTPEQEAFLKTFEQSLKKNSAGMKKASDTSVQPPPANESPVSIHFDQCTQLALLPLYLSNFIGVLCARSLHYQFYVWYFHSLPHLAWSTDYSLGVRFMLLGLIEFCWNTYPSTNFSSSLLHLCHLALLVGVSRSMWRTMRLSAAAPNVQQTQQQTTEIKGSDLRSTMKKKAKKH